jgi:hypothetical protein
MMGLVVVAKHSHMSDLHRRTAPLMDEPQKSPK